MALLLALETATPVCSVCLALDGKIMALRESTEPNVHSAKLTIFIEEILAQSGLTVSSLGAIAVSRGPGSYTGLRIGVAVAKGLCYGLDIPLIAVPTLRAMAEGMRGEPIRYLYCPMIDARRMEVYCAVYSEDGQEILPVDARIITEESFSGLLQDHIILFGGDGAAKCRPILGAHQNARFQEDFRPSSRYLIPLAEEKMSLNQFENPAYFEPFYLKDFVAGKPKVKGL